MDNESKLAVAFGTFKGYHDASTGDFPAGTINAGDYWKISFAGTLGGELEAIKGDLLLAVYPDANSPDKFTIFDADFDIPKFMETTTGSPLAAAYGWYQRVTESYTGPFFRIQKGTDPYSRMDIGYTEAGILDEEAMDLFLDGSDGYLQKACDITGNGFDVETENNSEMPLMVKVNGVVGFKGINRFLKRSGFIGDQAEVTMSVLYQTPATMPGGLTATHSGMNFGPNRTGAVSFRWTTGWGPHFFLTTTKQAEAEMSDGEPRLLTIKMDDLELTAFEGGAQIGTASNMGARIPFDRIEFFTNNDNSNSDSIIFGAWFWTTLDPNPQTIYQNMVESMPGLFPSSTDLMIVLVDSIGCSAYCDPNPSWPRAAILDSEISDRLRVVGAGGWTAQKHLDNISRIRWYIENLSYSNLRVLMHVGTNDLLTETAATTLQRLEDLSDAIKNISPTAEVGVMTPFPRFNTGSNSVYQGKRATLTSSLVANANSKFDYVIDSSVSGFAMGQDGAQNNPGSTYYIDEEHPSSAGQVAAAAFVADYLGNL